MRTIIAGSRTITAYSEVLDALNLARHEGIYVTTVISGTARGVDQLGERYAREANLPLEKYPADWEKHGKSAGYKRNEQMASIADALIAVTNGSPGTRHMIEIAKRKGLLVFVKEVRTKDIGITPEEKLLRAIFKEPEGFAVKE